MVDMVFAYVLVNCETGQEDKAIGELRKIPGVEESHVIYGVYDCLLKIRADSADKLKETITWKVRRADYVRSTLTMLVIE